MMAQVLAEMTRREPGLPALTEGVALAASAAYQAARDGSGPAVCAAALAAVKAARMAQQAAAGCCGMVEAMGAVARRVVDARRECSAALCHAGLAKVAA